MNFSVNLLLYILNKKNIEITYFILFYYDPVGTGFVCKITF